MNNTNGRKRTRREMYGIFFGSRIIVSLNTGCASQCRADLPQRVAQRGALSPREHDRSMRRRVGEVPQLEASRFDLYCELGEQRDSAAAGDHLDQRRETRRPELELVRFNAR